jgi:flagellar basal body-associated protein FliL
MKKKIIPIAIIAVLVIAIITVVIIEVTSLSGKYDFVYTGRVVVPEPFEYADTLNFVNGKIQYDYTILFTNMTAANDERETKYSVKGNKLVVYISDEETLSYDFKKDGDTIYIGDSVWRKNNGESDNQDDISKADKELARYFASVEWDNGTCKVTPRRLLPLEICSIDIVDKNNATFSADDIVLGDDMICIGYESSEQVQFNEAGSRVKFFGVPGSYYSEDNPITLISNSKDFSPIIIDSFSETLSGASVSETFIPEKIVITFRIRGGLGYKEKVTKYVNQ